MSRRALGCAAALALAVAGCGGDDARTPPRADAGARAGSDARRVILMASGRDDHGLRARSHVSLQQEPRFAAARRTDVPDGALVRVLEVRDEWHRVRAVEPPAAHGWVHDFHLRGTVHLVGANRHGAAHCAAWLSTTPGAPAARRLAANVQAEMLAAARRDGVTWVRVRTVAARDDGWVRAHVIRELPGCRTQPHGGHHGA